MKSRSKQKRCDVRYDGSNKSRQRGSVAARGRGAKSKRSAKRPKAAQRSRGGRPTKRVVQLGCGGGGGETGVGEMEVVGGMGRFEEWTKGKRDHAGEEQSGVVLVGKG